LTSWLVIRAHVEVGIASDGIAFGSFCEAPIAESLCELRVEPDGLVEVLNGKIVLALGNRKLLEKSFTVYGP
jgi:hypothetical protein